MVHIREILSGDIATILLLEMRYPSAKKRPILLKSLWRAQISSSYPKLRPEPYPFCDSATWASGGIPDPPPNRFCERGRSFRLVPSHFQAETKFRGNVTPNRGHPKKIWLDWGGFHVPSNAANTGAKIRLPSSRKTRKSGREGRTAIPILNRYMYLGRTQRPFRIVHRMGGTNEDLGA